MLVLHEADDFDNLIPLNLKDDEWYITHVFDGQDTLTIDIDSNNKYYQYMFEEVRIDAVGLRGNDARFTIKNIDEHSDAVTVTCNIDLNDWQRTIIDSFREQHTNLPTCLDKIIPSDWTYDGATGFSDDVTVEDSRDEPFKACTPLEILTGMADIFGCTYNYDNLNKILHVINPDSYTTTGEFLSEELNLKSLGYTGDTTSFATRLYAYGKRDDNGENPVTLESVNNGKPYIDNNEYSDEVIAVGWSDERYTIPENLLSAAKEKLAEIAKPARSYECDVKHLDYSVWMYKVVTIVDVRRKTRVNQQVVEWKEYARPDQDVVTLSETSPSIEKIVTSIPNVDDEIGNAFGSINAVINQAVSDATDAITGNNGGYFKWIFDSDGRPTELVNLGDSLDLNNAKQVWRWNRSGLGHSNTGYNGSYTLAILANGSINADVITTGTLNAARIRAGVLQDVKGTNYWNLETGQFKLSSNTTVGGQTVQTIANNAGSAAANNKWDTTTQRDVFDKLTNNGSAQGIYMSGSQLYINGEYIKVNTVSTNKIEEYRNSSLYTTVGTTVSGNTGTSFVNKDGNYCDLEALKAVDDRSGKTSGFGFAVFDKPIIHCSTYYDQLWLHPPIYSQDYLRQPPEQLYLRSASGSGAGKGQSYAELQINENKGIFIGTSGVSVKFDSTHYVAVDSSGVYMRCGGKGFGWYNGAFSSSLKWD